MLVLLASYRMVRYITLLMFISSFVALSRWFFYTIFMPVDLTVLLKCQKHVNFNMKMCKYIMQFFLKQFYGLSFLGFLYLNLLILISSAYDPNLDKSEILSSSSFDSSLSPNLFNIL